MKDFTELLALFDNLQNKTFNEDVVGSHIEQFIKARDGQVEPFMHWEQAAFHFWPNYQNDKTGWGTYFGPRYILPNNEGMFVEYPSIQMLKPEILDYYWQRAQQATHPVLKARYAGLVYDFHHKITSGNTPYAARILYINSLIDTANGDYHHTPINTVEKLKRAFRVAAALTDQNLKNRCKKAIIRFEKSHGQDELPGLWGYSFDLLVGTKKSTASPQEEEFIINELLDKYDRLLQNKEEPSTLYRNVEFVAERLAKHYQQKEQTEKARGYILQLCQLVEEAIIDNSAMHSIAQFERLHELCHRFGLKEKARNYLLKIRELSAQSHDEMKVFSFEYSVSGEEVEEFAKLILRDNPLINIARIGKTFIPVLADFETKLKEDAKKNPLAYIVNTRLLDGKGRVKAVLGSLESDPEGHLFNAIGNNLKTRSAVFLHYLLKKAMKEMGLNKALLIDVLSSASFIAPERIELIELGLDAYLEEKYSIAIHMLIPQIEEAVRNILEQNGGVILNYNPDGSYQVRTFDSILRDEITIGKLTENLANYFRLLFTDPRGLNLRNDVCHGLSEPKALGIMAADRVIHALFCLTGID